MSNRPSNAGSPEWRPNTRNVEPSEDFDGVFSLVYEELRRLASAVRMNDKSITLNSTALVHDAWIKLRSSPHLAKKDVLHFKAIAARAMRQVLVDAARKRLASKRGAGELTFVQLSEFVAHAITSDRELLSLNSALDQLEQLNSRQARVVECRFFGGLNVTEAAGILGVSESVIERDWRAARAWLANTIRCGSEV
jgi:RNA polymerase sigma factor (TIGR02999 family)